MIFGFSKDWGPEDVLFIVGIGLKTELKRRKSLIDVILRKPYESKLAVPQFVDNFDFFWRPADRKRSLKAAADPW